MADDGENKLPRIGIAFLNLTGLGLGYLFLKNWKRWALHIAVLTVLILLATLAHASAQPALWILVFVSFLLWMAYDGWKLARKENAMPPGQVFKNPWLLFSMIALILAGEVLGFLWFQSSARSVYQSALEEMKDENYAAAASLFKKAVSNYQLSFDPAVIQAEEKYQEVAYLVTADEACQQGQFKSAIFQYDEYLKLYPRSSQVKAVQNQVASTYREWGKSLQKQEKYQEALEKYSIALQTYPNAPVIKYFYEERGYLNLQLARQQVKNGDYSSAIDTYQLIINNFSKSAPFSQAWSEIPAVYLRYAQEEESKGNYDSALFTLNKILTDHPSAPLMDRVRVLMPEIKLKKAGSLLTQRSFLDALSLLDEIDRTSMNADFLSQLTAKRELALNILSRDKGKDALKIMQLAKNIACGDDHANHSDLTPLIPLVVGSLHEEPVKVDACDYDPAELTPQNILLDLSVSIPASVKADIPGTFRYVIKRADNRERIQTCNYTGGHKLERCRRTVSLSLIDVISGKVITKGRLVGTNPDACPNRRAFSVLTEQTYGGSVTSSQVEAWILKVLK